MVGTLLYAGKKHDGIRVFVSIPPQAYFVERIGGIITETSVLVNPGQSPATFELMPHQMIELSTADIYFRIGLTFEKHLLDKIKSTMTDLSIIDTRSGIVLRSVNQLNHSKDHHNEFEKHDPHVWLDPSLVKVQARIICDELMRVNPLHADYFENNLVAFLADLDSVDARIREILSPFRGKSFYVFHPAYGYFADAYGLNQIAVEIEGKEPGARGLAGFIDRVKKEKVKTIFVQPQFSRKSAKTITDAVGGVVVPMDPLAYDYLENLGDMARKLVSALEEH